MIILNDETTTLQVPVSKDGWLKLNEDFTNWHLVQYENTLLHDISTNMSSLNSLNRLNIAFETIALAKAGIYSITDYLNLLDNSFSSENSYSMWGEGWVLHFIIIFREFQSEHPRLSKQQYWINLANVQ